MEKIQNKNIDFVILDCDNILINTDTVLVSVMLDVLEEFGIDLQPDEAIRYFGGKSLEDCIIVLKKLCGTVFYKNYETHLSQKLDKEIFHGIESLEGVNDFLNTLPCSFFIISSEDLTAIKTKLALAGLESFFSSKNIFSVSDNDYWSAVLNIVTQHNFNLKNGLLIKDRPQNTLMILENGLSLACPGDFLQAIDSQYYAYENIQELGKKYNFR